MFGKIIYISDNIAFIENNIDTALASDILNLHLIFENNGNRILGEIVEINVDKIQVKLLGEFAPDGHYSNGILHKASLNSSIRIINSEELLELIGQASRENFLLGQCAMYKGFNVYPIINDLFANHTCIFGNSGSGKSCGVARIVQNILSNPNAIAYNANLIFFDSFGEYKNAFSSIGNINSSYNYKFITANSKDTSDVPIHIPLNLLTVDDYAILLQADKHSQLTIIDRALKYAKIFATDDDEARQYKNMIIANALTTVLYSNNTVQQKKDDVFSIINTCHTPEFNFDSTIPGLGYTRTFSECFALDSSGRFGEEVLIMEYILKYTSDNTNYNIKDDVSFTLADFAKALDFTLISEGFTQNKNMHDDAQLLKVRLHTILNNEIGTFFTSEYVPVNDFIQDLVTINNHKAQIININLEALDDSYAKSLVKVYSHIIFEFSKGNANRATMPFHLFLEEAHRYIQRDNDVFLLGYNIFERIAKEGRKYGVLLNIISQRPMEISDTVISQCSNFLIFKMTHPMDIKYIEEMLPNISQDVIDKMKVLQPGTCVSFGTAFKIPLICKLEMPNPRPYSSSCDVSNYWVTNNADINYKMNNNVNNNYNNTPQMNNPQPEVQLNQRPDAQMQNQMPEPRPELTPGQPEANTNKGIFNFGNLFGNKDPKGIANNTPNKSPLEGSMQ